MADATPPIPPMPAGPPEPPEVTTCYRHSGRRAGVVCQRCDRPICPSCMTAASVGFQCPECVKKAAKASPTITARAVADRPPIATYGLVAANIAVFLAQLSSGGSLTGMDHSTVTYNYAVQSGIVSTQAGLLVGHQAPWYVLFTGAFLHADIIHLALNMFVLFLVGPQLERALGAARYLALYFVALVGGSLAVVLMGQQAIGASGAIFGLLGAAAAYQYKNHINMLQSGLAMLIGLNLVFSLQSGISLAAHVGGLLAGAVTGFLMFELEQRRTPEWVVVTGAAILLLALTFGGVLAIQHVAITGHGLL